MFNYYYYFFYKSVFSVYWLQISCGTFTISQYIPKENTVARMFFFLNYITSFRYFLSSEFTKVKNLLPWNLKANIHFKARFECLKIGMITFDITSLLGKLTLRTHKQRTFLQDYLANFKVSNIVTECDGGSLFVKINPVFFFGKVRDEWWLHPVNVSLS